MTALFRYPGNISDLRLGSDGEVPSAKLLKDDDCCGRPICFSPGEQAKQFMDLLPSGPMWDGQRQLARDQIAANGCEIPANGFECTTLFSYAAFLAQMLNYIMEFAAQPVIREADPYTATELDEWLERLGWVDCYRSQCRSEYLAMFSPYEESDSTCGGTAYCHFDFPEEFELALKHNIIRALKRLQRGVVKNLDGINWVLEPLGAKLQPVQPYCDTVQEYMDAEYLSFYEPYEYTPDSLDECDTCWCQDVALEIISSGSTLEGAPTVASFCDPDMTSQPAAVTALQTYECNGIVTSLFPGVIAAECIARTMLPRPCPNIIYRAPGSGSCAVECEPSPNANLCWCSLHW